MDVKIYKIDTGITGKNFSNNNRNNFPIGGKTNSFYSVGNLMRGIEDFYLQGNLYFIDKEEELEKFENPLGERWIAKKKYYISHPKKEKENLLIEANKFHEYIFREQLEEIADYISSELHINFLKIEVEEGSDFSSYTNVPIEGINLNGDGRVVLKNSKILEIKWNEKFIEDNLANSFEKNSDLNKNLEDKKILDINVNKYLWIEDFKELIKKVNNVKSSNSNKFIYNLDIGNSFGISEKIGKKIGVNPNWLKKCTFKLEI